jgi:hypothetical protein
MAQLMDDNEQVKKENNLEEDEDDAQDMAEHWKENRYKVTP